MISAAVPAAFWVAAGLIVLFLFASAAPTPLYGVYRAEWGFSAATLTVAGCCPTISLAHDAGTRLFHRKQHRGLIGGDRGVSTGLLSRSHHGRSEK